MADNFSLAVQLHSDDSTAPKSCEGDHLQKTVNQPRESKAINMEVTKIFDISPTVKYLVLRTEERPVPISFKAEQWVDMSIPGVDTVGGFTICSSPLHLSTTGELCLSVKKSDHPPADWVHSKCTQSSVVSIRVGGDFFLDTEDPATSGKSILFVAGGVGINPFASIITQLQDVRKSVGSYSSNTCLMFSAKTKDELLFQDSFNETTLKDSTFSVQYFVTDSKGKADLLKSQLEENIVIKYGRITESDIVECLTQNLNLRIGSEDAKKNTLVYICGPPPMIQHVQDILGTLGFENVFYEKWW